MEISVDHPEYAHSVTLSEEQVAELLSDLFRWNELNTFRVCNIRNLFVIFRPWNFHGNDTQLVEDSIPASSFRQTTNRSPRPKQCAGNARFLTRASNMRLRAERDGVWGGMTAVERQRMIRRMRRQRRLQLVTAS